MADAVARLNALAEELGCPDDATFVDRNDLKEMTLLHVPERMVVARIAGAPRDRYIQVDVFGLGPLTERGHINYVEDHKLPGIIKSLLED